MEYEMILKKLTFLAETLRPLHKIPPDHIEVTIGHEYPNNEQVFERHDLPDPDLRHLAQEIHEESGWPIVLISMKVWRSDCPECYLELGVGFPKA